MTAGTFALGADHYGPLYVRRNWSGDDSKLLPGAVNDHRTQKNAYSATYQRLLCNGSLTVPSRKLSGDYQVPHLWSTEDEFRIQSALVEAVKGHQFNLLVTTAQSHETFKMVHSTIASCGNAMRHLKRGRIDLAARSLGIKGKHSSKLDKDDVAGRWLELQYGWLPMIGDVYEGMNAFAALNNRPRQALIRVRRSSAPVPWGGSSSPSNYQNMAVARSRRQILYWMDEDLATRRSLGLTDPWSLAWELIPYSFVIDWFIPIGSYLENLHVIPKLTGTFVETTYTHSPVHVEILQNWIYYSGGKVDGETFRIDRTVRSGLATAMPRFKNAGRIFSPAHFWNGLALSAKFF